MKIPNDGKVCRKAWKRSGHEPISIKYELVFVYTVYPDKLALVEFLDGPSEGVTTFIHADTLVWDCRCDSLLLFREGCQCR